MDRGASERERYPICDDDYDDCVDVDVDDIFDCRGKCHRRLSCRRYRRRLSASKDDVADDDDDDDDDSGARWKAMKARFEILADNW